MSTIQPKVDEPVSDELALVQAAKAGDVGAFEDLVRRYDRNVELRNTSRRTAKTRKMWCKMRS